MNEIVMNLRAVDRKRLDNLQERTETPLASGALGGSDTPQGTFL
jgi:hypothetical protein